LFFAFSLPGGAVLHKMQLSLSPVISTDYQYTMTRQLAISSVASSDVIVEIAI